MAKDNSNSFNTNHSYGEEQDSNKSFVKKVRSRMSELLPSSLSKWFGSDNNHVSIVRQRDDDDDSFDIQPPLKKFRRPSPVNELNHIQSSSSTVTLDTSTLYNAAVEDAQSKPKNVFQEPVAGPSGIKSRKALTSFDLSYTSPEIVHTNDEKDSDSGESTSGYSSMARISHKGTAGSLELKKVDSTPNDIDIENLTSSNVISHTRSLFMERSLSPQMNSSLSSRRPSFNASTFGSPSFIDRTLSTKRIINSPFYNGRTTYGGASAYSYQQKKLKDNHALLKRQIEVKPAVKSSGNDSTTLSKTARRILDVLDQYTTPLSDAKKIPTPAKRSRTEGLLLKYTCANPYSIRDHKAIPSASNKELVVPTVPEMLKMKLKEKLQDSTESVRKIATTSTSALNNQYSIRTIEEKTPKHTNKLKNKISATRQKPQNEVVEEVKLPDISLTITTLPKFDDFTLPLPPSCSKPLVTVPSKDPIKLPQCTQEVVKSKENVKDDEVKKQAKSNLKEIEYKFSNPEVLSENLIAITAINDFKFSNPVNKLRVKNSSGSTPVVNFKSVDVVDNFKSFDQSNLKLKRKEQPAPVLLMDTVESAFGNNKKSLNLLDKFKPAAGSWECNSCLIRNLPDRTICAACSTPKLKSSAINETTSIQKNTDFGDKFKLSADKWECSMCMVRNVNTDTKCVSCTTPRVSNEKSVTPITPLNNSFGNKFKPPSGTWECPACMIRNKNEIDKCMACTTSKPGTKPIPTNGFGNQFKPSSSSWECPTCMIRNKNETEKCIACETLKPGAKPLPTNGFGKMFAKKDNEWECSVCMIRNKNDNTKCISCETPNPNSTSANASEKKKEKSPINQFKFGIFPGATTSIHGFKSTPNTDKGDEIKTTVPISSIFGTTTSTPVTSSAIPSFSFGIPKSPDTFENKSKRPASEEGIKTAAATFVNPTPSSPPSFGKTSTEAASNVEEKSKSTMDIPKPKLREPSNMFTFGSTSTPVKQQESTESKLNLETKVTSSSTAVTKPEFIFNSNASVVKSSPISFEPSNTTSRKRTSTSDAIFASPNQLHSNASGTNLVNNTKPNSASHEVPNKISNNLFGSIAPPASLAASISSTPNTLGFNATQAQLTVPSTTSGSSNLFTFGSSKLSSGFGNPNTTTEPSGFKFGSTASPISKTKPFEINTSAQPAIPSNVFTSTPSSMFGAPNKSVFEVPNKPVTNNSMFETSNKSAFDKPNKAVFDVSNKSVFQATNKTAFDQPSKSMFEIPSKPAFDAAPNVPTIPSFGATSFGSSAPEMKPFLFGSTPNDNVVSQKPPAFPFGQQTKTTPGPKPPVFSFGNHAPPSSTSGGFNFGSNNNSAPNNNFNFTKVDNPTSFQSSIPPPASNMFGTSAQIQPQVQPVQNGGFNFGSAASNSTGKTGFNFGNAPPASQFCAQPPAAPAGVFSFGSSNQNPAPSAPGGFNFGSAPAPAPTFNANITPTFNFTGGAATTFTAQPASGDTPLALQQRKKIRAVRRTQR